MDSTVTNDAYPNHIAIIMDGNGRWANKRGLPRVAGHRSGVKALRNIVEYASDAGIKALTVYAFSSENWQRPKQEVSLLMELFMTTLKQEINELKRNNVQLKFIGNTAEFPRRLQDYIHQAETNTAQNTGLQFNIAANYGGQWDITQAARQLAKQVAAGKLDADDIDEQKLDALMALHDQPKPDLFIRTGGEKRISNYLLWQLAYTEMYFTDCLWPDFSISEFEIALDWYAGRERRYGRISEQLV